VRPTHADRDGAAKGPRDDRAAPERNSIIGSCVGKDRSGAVREGDFSARCGVPNGLRAALIFDARQLSPPRATDTAGARAEERFERGPLSVSGMTIGSATTRNEADAKPWRQASSRQVAIVRGVDWNHAEVPREVEGTDHELSDD
jgi:hypothetical protein